MAATRPAPMTRVVRALYRSLLPLAVSLDHNPMLRLFGLPPGQQPPRFFTPTLTSSNSSTLSTLQLLRDCFRSPPPGMDESHAFTALRGINAMRSKLAGLGDVEGGHTPRVSLSSALFRAPSTHLHAWLPKGDGSSRGVPHGSMAPGTLLVSHPSLSPPFQHSVILLLATHPEEGCVGVVLNGGELPSTPATSSPNPQKETEELHQQRQPYPPSSPWVPALSFAPLSPPLHPTLLHSPGRVSPAQRHPYTNLHSLRYYASPHTQFTLSGGEIAVGALRAVGVHSLLHPSGLCAVVGGRFGVDHDNDSDDDGEGGRGGRVEAAPRRTEGVLPIGPGLDAPAPPWIKKAAKAWLANPEHQHLLNYGHWQKQVLPQQSGCSMSPLPLNPTPPGGGISPLYGRIFSHLSLSQRRHNLRRLQSTLHPQQQQQQQQGGGGGSGGGGGVGRWHGKQALKVSYAFTAGGGKHGVSAFDASPGASIGLRRGGVVEKEEQDVEEEEEEEESVEGVTMPPSLPSSLPLWGTDDDAEHFGDVTWGLGGSGGGGGVGGNSSNHPGGGYGGGTTTTTSTIPTTFSSPAFFAPNSSPSAHTTSFSSSMRPGVREDRDEEEGEGEDEEDGLEAEDEDEDEEFELLVGLKKAGEEGEEDGSVGEGEDEDAFTSSSYSSNFSRRRLRRSSSGVVGGGGASEFFSRLSSPLPTFTSKSSSGGGGGAGRGQREGNQQQQSLLLLLQQQQQRQGRWGGRHGRRSNVTLFPPSHFFSQSRGQLTHVIAQHLGGDDAVVTLPVFVTIPASLSRARAATLGGGGGSKVVEGALHYYPAGAQGAVPAVMCEGGARLLSLPHIRRLARAMHALKKGEGGVVAAAAAPLSSTKFDDDTHEGALLPSTPSPSPSFTYYSGVVSPSSTAAAAKLVGKQAALPPPPPVIRWGGPVVTVPYTLTRVDHEGELSGLSPMTTTVVQEMGEGETFLRGGRSRRGGSRGGGFSSSSLKSALEGWVGEDGGGGEEGITIQPPIVGRVGQMPAPRIRIQAGMGGGEKGGGVGRHVYSGLATWAPGQLESELREGVWYTVQVEDVWGKGVVGGSSSEGVGRGLWESVLRAVGGWHGKVVDATSPPNSPSC